MDLYEPVLVSYLMHDHDIVSVKNSDSVWGCLVDSGRSDYVKDEQRSLEDNWNCP